MIKGLAITQPVIGRISIGKVVEKDGKRLPQKDGLSTFFRTKYFYQNHSCTRLALTTNRVLRVLTWAE